MSSLKILCFIVVIVAVAHAYVSRNPSSLAVRYQRRSLPLYANSIMMDRQKSLGSVKERYQGREDLVSLEADEVEDYNSFAEADDEEVDPPKKGQKITGTIIDVDETGVFIDIGGKMSGFMPATEASLIGIKNMNNLFQVGQEITGDIIGKLKGMPVVSLRAEQLVAAWDKILKLRADDAAVTVKVLEVNRGGAVCDLFGLKAFLPGSHYIGNPDASLIGTTLEVRFLDANEEDGKIVVSRRRALTQTQPQLERGSVIEGTVTGLRQYGAFLELTGGQAGLLHISQISFERIENLENIFTVGEKCKVMIIDHDRANNRVALSTKALEITPGDMLR
jgi:small subunit ribosomal protein S1